MKTNLGQAMVSLILTGAAAFASMYAYITAQVNPPVQAATNAIAVMQSENKTRDSEISVINENLQTLNENISSLMLKSGLKPKQLKLGN